MFNKQKFKIPLDKFMFDALYHPTKGYYMKQEPFGKKGDFVTAPNISNIFSEMIFIWMISYWKKFHEKQKINFVELGSGNGDLMLQIINSSKKFTDFYENCNFIIYEKSKKLTLLQKKILKKSKVKWIKNLDEIKNNPSIFFGNEFLDALPIKQFINDDNKWYERYVEKKRGEYKFVQIKYDIKKIEKKLNFKISKKQNFLEISLDAIRIIKKINKFIQKKNGCILFIDYGYLNREMMNTLQAVKNHKKINIFKKIGHSDISSMINIPFLKQLAKELNLELKYTTQRNFLLNLGILKRAELLAINKKFLEKANIFYRVNRLIDKKQMGELFKVIYFSKKNEKFSLGFK